MYNYAVCSGPYKYLTGTNLSHPLRFCPAVPQPGKRWPSKAEAQSRPLMERQTDRILPKGLTRQAVFYHFCYPGQPARLSVPIYYPFSTFSIVYARTTHQQPPAGPDAEQRQPFPFGSVPLHHWPAVRASPWGGMRLSRRESLPPQKFISRVDFSFFHSVKLILFLTVSFQR